MGLEPTADYSLGVTNGSTDICIVQRTFYACVMFCCIHQTIFVSLWCLLATNKKTFYISFITAPL